MERDELRTTLVNHLETLRRNLQVVSMEVLKTKYKKPFDVLRQDICKAATAYTRFLVFDGMQHFPGGISPLRMLLHGW